MSYFDDDTINEVWEKADPIPGVDSNVWRTHGEPLRASEGYFGIQATKPLTVGLGSTTQPSGVWDPPYSDALKKAYFEGVIYLITQNSRQPLFNACWNKNNGGKEKSVK